MASPGASRHPVLAVRIFAYDASQRILLVRRANTEYALGRWCLPGGKLDYGDAPERAVEKELVEETDLVADDIEFLFYQNSPPLAPGGMHCINLYFRCIARGTVRLNEESSESTWSSLQEALAYEPVFGAGEAIRRVLEMST
jgi:8-oxo-dGTP diphosphatase